MSILSERLRRAMGIRGLSQSELAERCDVSQSHISKLLKAERVPTVDTLLELARPLGVSLDWLMGGEDTRLGALPPEEEELVKLYRQIPYASLRDTLVATARLLSEVRIEAPRAE